MKLRRDAIHGLALIAVTVGAVVVFVVNLVLVSSLVIVPFALTGLAVQYLNGAGLVVMTGVIYLIWRKR